MFHGCAVVMLYAVALVMHKVIESDWKFGVFGLKPFAIRAQDQFLSATATFT